MANEVIVDEKYLTGSQLELIPKAFGQQQSVEFVECIFVLCQQRFAQKVMAPFNSRAVVFDTQAFIETGSHLMEDGSSHRIPVPVIKWILANKASAAEKSLQLLR